MRHCYRARCIWSSSHNVIHEPQRTRPRVRRGFRVLFRWQLLLPWLLATPVAFGGWDFTPAGDPNRNWAANVTVRGVYNDNFYETAKNPEAGFQSSSDFVLRASVPLERLFMGLNYDYNVTYPRDIKLGGIDQTHNVTLAANYTFNPRLTLAVNENYISSIQPQLVQSQAGVPVPSTVIQAGNYTYDMVGGNLNYVLTPRWSLSLNGNWDIWSYAVSSVASNNNRQDYQMTLSALYMLDQRTTAGINYQYGQNIFVDPGLNNGLNAQWNTAYLSLVRVFNPRLSVQLNGGYTIREAGDGTTSTAPTGYGSLAYNYGLDSTISLTAGYALNAGATAGIGFTRQFSASESTTVALQVNHRLTQRLRTVVGATYVLGTFLTPVYVFTLSGQDQSLTGHVGLSYSFRDWLSVVLDYYYTHYTESISFFPVYTFDQNQISAGVTLTY